MRFGQIKQLYIASLGVCRSMHGTVYAPSSSLILLKSVSPFDSFPICVIQINLRHLLQSTKKSKHPIQNRISHHTPSHQQIQIFASFGFSMRADSPSLVANIPFSHHLVNHLRPTVKHLSSFFVLAFVDWFRCRATII